MNVSKALKLCRTQKGLTKTALAEKANLSISYLSLLEQGKRDPNLSAINDICTALDIPVSIFMFLASDMEELEGVSDELAQMLSHTALKLMEVSSDDTKVSS
ncbi:XRE family transcriptional regulator [Pseudoalteromonas sp. CO342X]|uniref:helix-turn-helix domain-containing protein n=1 Tax=Pseudoalteromonas sp. CO342X TaxID=1777270 RepID=UPI001022C38C|nr:helix-turn-helix transcriptional regulator [Pseudoalteromonas sp. CO342X]RZG16737.1 XRE family transcriptional regulator [Pseudoalteromonas sp. CO342X]